MPKISTTIKKTCDQFEIFVDLDRVLADIGKGLNNIFRVIHGRGSIFSQERYEQDSQYKDWMWETCEEYQKRGGEVWYELDMMEDAWDLWDYVKPYNPKILSATAHAYLNAAPQKRRWVAERLGDDVQVFLTLSSAEKARHAAPGHILIDDRPGSINPWIENGGIGILHTSAKQSISELKRLGVGNEKY